MKLLILGTRYLDRSMLKFTHIKKRN